MTNIYDILYFSGGFNQLGEREIEIFQKLKKSSKKIIVGVYDDITLRIVEKLKVGEHQPLDIRMEKVKKYANQVYVLTSSDSSFLLGMIHDSKPGGNYGYLVLDDNYFFTGHEYIRKNFEVVKIEELG